MHDEPKHPLTVVRHDPERRRHHTPVILAQGCLGACSCCCCCCLHTVGSLLGATVASVKPPVAAPEANSGAGVYWCSVVAVSVLALFALIVRFGAEAGLIVGALGLALLMPAVQLVASVVALIVIGIFYRPRGPALARVGWITLGTFLGAVAGGVVLVAVVAILANVR